MGGPGNGKQDNLTVATLMRYAAIGKRFVWSFEDLATEAPGEDGKVDRRRGKRRA